MSSRSKTVAVRSYAKINLGLYIGARRVDGFHELRTVYQTIALHDVIRVRVDGIEIGGIEIGPQKKAGKNGSHRFEIVCECDDPRVPLDESNTCYRIAARLMETLGARGSVTIEIEKRLPVQGGLGAASSNAVATMIAMERVLASLRVDRARRGKPRVYLTAEEKFEIAAEVGSDLPLFLIGGTVLGVGRGEEVYPLEDLPSAPMVVVTPEVGVSTPKAFAEWDRLANTGELTDLGASDKLSKVGHALSAWLSGNPDAGAPARGRSGGRAGNLSDLVRAGIENDFERVVFSEFPELRDMKRALVRAGSIYASLSGSGSTLYGLFESPAKAAGAARALGKEGLKAVATRTLTRKEYWKRSLVVGR